MIVLLSSQFRISRILEERTEAEKVTLIVIEAFVPTVSDPAEPPP